MTSFEKEEKKTMMLGEIRQNRWETDVDSDSTYNEVKRVYEEMLGELLDVEDSMFPNGRDED